MEPLHDQVREWVLLQLRAGFESDPRILQGVEEYLADDFEAKDIRRAAAELLPGLKDQLKREEASWPETTDNDRLERAFDRLRSQGLVVRENFTCCQTCGFAEIEDEVEKEAADRRIVGFTFYHQQDTESAVDGFGVALAYASTSGDQGDSLRVGKMIAAAMQEEGLTLDWDETLAKRIVVKMDWKRRRRSR